MPRRMGRPGLVGTMARTAVIAGTASAVVGHSQRNQAQRAQAQAAAPAPAEPVAEGEDWSEKLQQLNTLKNQGVLSEEEFTAAKAKIIDSMTA